MCTTHGCLHSHALTHQRRVNTMNTATTDTPRVYIAVLADYNNGVLTGEWIDATDADDMRDEIKRILRTSKYPNVILVCPNCDGNKHIECDDGQIETCVVSICPSSHSMCLLPSQLGHTSMTFGYLDVRNMRLISSRISSASAVSYTHLRAHETGRNLVCRLLLEK